MNAHSRALETAGKNLANVSNSSYARQRVVYGDRGTVMTDLGAQSMGLEALRIEQVRDVLLDRQVVREVALTSYYDTQQKAYARAQAALGQSVSSATSKTATDTGIGGAITSFFNAFQGFASDPTGTGARQKVIEAATILTDRVRLADSRLTQVQSDLDTQVASDISAANGLLETIADLNDQISRFEVNNPGSAVDLRDQRQAALEKLAEKISFTASTTDDGKVLVSATYASGSVYLVDERGSTGGTEVNGIHQTLSYNAATGTVSGGNPTEVLTLGSAGSIRGAIEAKTGAVQDLRDDLNLLVQQMVETVNTTYKNGYTGPAGTGNFFAVDTTAPIDPVSAANFALDASVTATSLRSTNTGAAGGRDIADALAALATKEFSTPANFINGTFSGFYTATVITFGQAASTATTRLEEQTSIETLVRDQRDAVSGVSLDEELADLIKFQRAFQASSRVFQTIDNLLDVVVNQLGR
jgi:flagellar hook-associated protein 1 FlgK